MSKNYVAKLVYIPKAGVPANFPISVGAPYNVMLPPSSGKNYIPVKCELTEAVNLAAVNFQLHLLDADNQLVSDEQEIELRKLLHPVGKTDFEAACDAWEVRKILCSDPGEYPVEEVAEQEDNSLPVVAEDVPLESLATGEIIPGPAKDESKNESKETSKKASKSNKGGLI